MQLAKSVQKNNNNSKNVQESTKGCKSVKTCEAVRKTFPSGENINGAVAQTRNTWNRCVNAAYAKKNIPKNMQMCRIDVKR